MKCDPIKWQVIFIFSIFALGNLGCGRKSLDDMDFKSGTGSSVPDSSSNIVYGVSFQIERKLEGTLDWIDSGDCVIPRGAATGTSRTCEISIDELDLYFSSLRFTVGGDPDRCTVVEFKPYYYVANQSLDVFEAFWNRFDPADCVASGRDYLARLRPISPECYGGVARHIVPSFPYYDLVYIVPEVTLFQSFEIPSAHQNSYGSNRYAVNDLVDRGGYLNIIGDGYVGDTMSDYVINCRDTKDDLIYQIVVNLKDTDGVTNDIQTWSAFD